MSFSWLKKFSFIKTISFTQKISFISKLFSKKKLTNNKEIKKTKITREIKEIIRLINIKLLINIFIFIKNRILKREAFIFIVGDNSLLLSYHHNNNSYGKALMSKLSNKNKKIIKNIIEDKPHIPIYILLDNSDQTYNMESYPSISRRDLSSLIKRKTSENYKSFPKKVLNNTLYNHKIQKTNNRKWLVSYISSDISNVDIFHELTDLLLETHNPIISSYLIPNIYYKFLEKNTILSNKKISIINIENNINILRQIILVDNNIRLVRNYDYSNFSQEFIKSFNDNISIINEFLKRSLNIEYDLDDVVIINILKKESIEALNKKYQDSHIVNYDIDNIKEKSNIKNKNIKSIDLLITRFFFNCKDDRDNIKFSFFKTKILNKYLNIFYIIKKINITILTLLIISYLMLSYKFIIFNDRKEEYSNDLQYSQNLFNNMNSNLRKKFNIKSNNDIEEIIFTGQFNSKIEQYKYNLLIDLQLLSILSFYDTYINNIFFTRDRYNNILEIRLIGKIYSSNGNIEELIEKYDNMLNKLKEIYVKGKKYILNSSALPSDINFGEKYYDLPVNFNIIINNK